MTSIGEHAFFYCEGLACIIVDSRNKVFDSRSNCNAIINTESNTLVVGCKTTIIPNSVTGIGNDTFNYCSGLTSIDIPNSVTSIGSRAFYCCYRLTSLEIPSSVISIGEYAFSGCIGLTSILVDDGNSVYDSRDNCNAIIETATNTLHTGCVYTTIPNNVSNIGTDAFFYCITLTSINIPKNVTSIGPYAFYNCFNLEKVIVEHETPISLVSETTFSNRFNATLYVPYGSKSAYEAAEVWKDFKEIVEMEPTELTLTLNQYGKSTYCSEYALDFTNVEGLKAYVATGYNTRTGVVTMTRVMTTKGGTGLFLKGEQGSYEVPIIAESDDNTLNLLVGTLAQVTLNSKDDTYTNYKFTVKAGETEPGFYNFADNSTLSANKAYLHIPTAWLPSTSAAKSVRMWFEDEEATGIDEINTNRPDSDTIYDMQGRREKTPSKGMYIVNGKKMIIN